MLIGVPKEIKNNEYRVSVVPAGVKVLVENGHEVLVEKGAGLGSGFSDEQYKEAGAAILIKEDVFNQAELIYKVKEFLLRESI